MLVAAGNMFYSLKLCELNTIDCNGNMRENGAYITSRINI